MPPGGNRPHYQTLWAYSVWVFLWQRLDLGDMIIMKPLEQAERAPERVGTDLKHKSASNEIYTSCIV